MKNYLVKKTVSNELVKEVDALQTFDASGLLKRVTMPQKLKILKRKFLMIPDN